MSFKDILVHVDATAASRTRLQLALPLARRFGASLSGLHVIPEPDVPPYFKPSVVDRIAKIYAENAREAADLAEALLWEEVKDAGATTAWGCVAGDMEEMIAEHARFADLLVLGQFDTENPPTVSAFLLPAKVVFGAPAPILVVPNNGTFSDIGTHALVVGTAGGKALVIPFSFSMVGGQELSLGSSSRLLFHQRGHNEARNEGQQPNGRDGPGESKYRGKEASGQRADGVAEVTPEPVDA